MDQLSNFQHDKRSASNVTTAPMIDPVHPHRAQTHAPLPPIWQLLLRSNMFAKVIDGPYQWVPLEGVESVRDHATMHALERFIRAAHPWNAEALHIVTLPRPQTSAGDA